MSEDVSEELRIAKALQSLERLARGEPMPSPALQRLGAALRRVSRWTLAELDESRIERAAAGLEALAGELDIGEEGPATRFSGPIWEGEELLANARGTHPLLGAVNPAAPHLEMRVEGDRLLGDVTFDVRFEGNDGWVHGGFVAAGFDAVCVLSSRLVGRMGPTASLSVRFRAPTPVGEPLRYEGRVVREEGRKVFTEGKLLRLDDGATTAEAEALVIAFD